MPYLIHNAIALELLENSSNTVIHFLLSTVHFLFRDHRSVTQHVASVCTALPTLLGPRTLIAHGLQRLMGCILPTMHYRSQYCWELLRPFARSLWAVKNSF